MRAGRLHRIFVNTPSLRRQYPLAIAEHHAVAVIGERLLVADALQCGTRLPREIGYGDRRQLGGRMGPGVRGTDAGDRPRCDDDKAKHRRIFIAKVYANHGCITGQSCIAGL